MKKLLLKKQIAVFAMTLIIVSALGAKVTSLANVVEKEGIKLNAYGVEKRIFSTSVLHDEITLRLKSSTTYVSGAYPIYFNFQRYSDSVWYCGFIPYYSYPHQETVMTSQFSSGHIWKAVGKTDSSAVNSTEISFKITY